MQLFISYNYTMYEYYVYEISVLKWRKKSSL